MSGDRPTGAPGVAGPAGAMTRRALLQGAGAAGLASGVGFGCGEPAARVPAGPPIVTLEGQDPARGHALRDGALLSSKVVERRRTAVLIVGAGVAGAAAAWALRRAGVRDLQVIELEDDVGGTARGGTIERDGVRARYPLGAHYLPSPPPHLRTLRTALRELGVEVGEHRGRAEYDLRAIVAAPQERHFVGGRWFEGLYPWDGQSGDEEAQWARFGAHLRELERGVGADGRRWFDLPVDRSSAALRHLDAITIAQYLDERGFTSPRLRWVVDYSCRDDWGCDITRCSAFAALHHFVARGLEDERDGVILTWPEGNARLVEGLIARAGVSVAQGDLRLGTAAIAIDPDRGEVLAHDVARGETIAYVADAVIWAAPRFVLSALLAGRRARTGVGEDPAARAGPGGLPTTPWIVTNVHLDRPPAGVGAPLAWDNVPAYGDDLGYVVAAHQRGRDEPEGPCVITAYEPLVPEAKGLPGSGAAAAGSRGRGPVDEVRAGLLAADAATLAGRALERLMRLHPTLGPHVRELRIARWGHAMVRPEPGVLFGAARRAAAAPVGRVIPAAADVTGLPLFEQAFDGGVRGAAAALLRLGRGGLPT